MYLMFVDESGDTGMSHSPSRYYILCGLVVHELRWRSVLDELLKFRREMKANFGLKLSDEIHAAHMFRSGGHLNHIQKHHRLEIIRRLADKLATMQDLSLISVALDKSKRTSDHDVFSNAWQALLQRFENTMLHKNFPGGKGREDRGIVLCDQTDEAKLRKLVRKMRAYNPIPNQQWAGVGYRNLGLAHIIEDPIFRNSRLSYLVQAVDVTSYLLKQRLDPSAYFKAKSGNNFFLRLQAICCHVAAPAHPQGVVLL